MWARNGVHESEERKLLSLITDVGSQIEPLYVLKSYSKLNMRKDVWRTLQLEILVQRLRCIELCTTDYIFNNDRKTRGTRAWLQTGMHIVSTEHAIPRVLLTLSCRMLSSPFEKGVACPICAMCLHVFLQVSMGDRLLAGDLSLYWPSASFPAKW